MDLIEQIAESMSRYSMVAPKDHIGVAVSGGADSTFLLHALHALLKQPITVLHVNHHLRGAESDADAVWVRNLARSMGLNCLTIDWNYNREDNLEQAARQARYKWFHELIRKGDLDRVATGHTKSDQAETVLFRLLRGTGPSGLAGVVPVTRQGIIRPLIGVERVEIEQWLSDQRISWREDATNRDTALIRNRIRHELLPDLMEQWNPRMVDGLAQLALLAADEEEYWHDRVEQLLPQLFLRNGNAWIAEVASILDKPAALRRRLVRGMIERAKGNLLQIDFSHIEGVLGLLSNPDGSGSGRIQIPGLDVFRSLDWVRFAEPGLENLENRNFSIPIPIPGFAELPGGGGISTELIESESVYTECRDDIDWGKISDELILRNWRPGDRYIPLGSPGEQKLKILFQDERIPLWERRHWPILWSGETLVWAKRFGVAAGFAAGPDCGKRLRIECHTPAAM